MGSLKFSQQYGNNKINVNQNQKVVTVPVGVVEPGDKHFIGVVQEITEEKFICSASEIGDSIECIKGCNAEVGDEVIICLMQDGQYVVVARVGGDLGGGTGGGVPPEYGSTTDYIAGKVFAFAGNVVPAGCLLCDGSEVSRSEYWELFSVIGTLYGAGDGSSTFNLPNIESRTIIGESDSYALGATGGEEKHTLTEAELPYLRGRAWFRNWTWGSGSQGSVFLSPDGIMEAEPGGTTGYDMLGYGSTQGGSNILKVEFGGDQPHNNMQPYIVMRYFITTGKADPASGINPADYIVEWGNTDDSWYWEKWASGKAYCCKRTLVSWTTGVSQWGGTYESTAPYTNGDYPFEFAKVPNAKVYIESSSQGNYMKGTRTTVSMFGTTKSSPRVYLQNDNAAPNYEKGGNLITEAFGIWKDSPATGGVETIAPTIAKRFEDIEADLLDMRTNKVLWSGANYISEGQTATLSEAISEQVHGIVLVFSLYEPSSSTVKDTDWSYHFVPKYHTMNHNEEGLAVSSLSQWLHMAKYFYVGDTVIRGNGNNGKNSMTIGNVTISNGSYVLRYVLGV